MTKTTYVWKLKEKNEYLNSKYGTVSSVDLALHFNSTKDALTWIKNLVQSAETSTTFVVILAKYEITFNAVEFTNPTLIDYDSPF